MEDDELVNFIIIFFSLGVVFLVYYPSLFNLILWVTAIVGAIYFVVGTISRLISGSTGKRYAWSKDWWHGLAILLMVGLIFGKMNIAIKVVWWFVYALLRLFTGVLTFHL